MPIIIISGRIRENSESRYTVVCKDCDVYGMSSTINVSQGATCAVCGAVASKLNKQRPGTRYGYWRRVTGLDHLADIAATGDK